MVDEVDDRVVVANQLNDRAMNRCRVACLPNQKRTPIPPGPFDSCHHQNIPTQKTTTHKTHSLWTSSASAPWCSTRASPCTASSTTWPLWSKAPTSSWWPSRCVPFYRPTNQHGWRLGPRLLLLITTPHPKSGARTDYTILSLLSHHTPLYHPPQRLQPRLEELLPAFESLRRVVARARAERGEEGGGADRIWEGGDR
jgi:hypothetical protein